MADEQLKYLEEATKKVKEQAFYMKRSMDGSDLKAALNHASDMLRELRTALLTPRNYYELYMKVLDEMRYLEEYFTNLQKQGKPVMELYEQVQSCGNVLPRLYLLITVGAVYIKSGEAPAKDILKDLVEMTKGVQHPMRGLFLRNYLSHATREKLPDAGSEYDEAGGTVENSIDFILQNFAETNRLWVRMQNQGPTKDKKRREKERQELRILVGTNLVRLSHLDGVDVGTYRETVLPRVLEQVANCKDTIAQSYLMDCIIQVFPDEFHLATLTPFLDTCTQLKEKVNVRAILESMMNRLSNYANGVPDMIPSDVHAFQMFNECVTKLLEERASSSPLDLCEVLRLQSALLEFALTCYPGRLDYVNHCLGMCVTVLGGQAVGTLDEASVEQIEKLLSAPLASLALRVLELAQYPALLVHLPWGARQQVAVGLTKAVVAANVPLSDAESIEKLFGMITPLLKDADPDDAAGGASAAPDADAPGRAQFEEEQLLVARLVHLMTHDDTDAQFRIYVTARRHFGQGGVQRIQYTLVPLVFGALRLARLVRKRESAAAPAAAADDDEAGAPPPAEVQFSCRKIFQFMHEIVTAMASAGYPDLSLKLFLQCAQGADQCEFKAISYEFVSQAFILYEDELTDSKAQLRALVSMVGTLLTCRNFDEGDYDALITKTTQYAAKLLKKPDQCRMVTLCSHLFWVGGPRKSRAPAADGDAADGAEAPKDAFHDAKRVLECLQRSLKIADVCMTSSMHVHLFVEILNQYLYYFENDNPLITDKYLSGLIALINEHIDNMDQNETRAEVEAHYRNTLRHIRRKQQSADSADKFAPIGQIAIS